MSDKPLHLCWIRRDMRLHDHAVLHLALQTPQARIQPVFVFDTEILARFSNPHDRRLSFIAATLQAMHRQLQAQGGGMLVLLGKASDIMPKLAGIVNAAGLFAAEDFEPSTRARDEAVSKALPATTRFCRPLDHLLFAPSEVLKDDGLPYKVFTPYANRWRSLLEAHHYEERAVNLNGRLAGFASLCKTVEQGGVKRIDAGLSLEAMLGAIGYQPAEISLWPVESAQEKLAAFSKARLRDYKEQRNFMADEQGTSRLSPYFRFGLLSVREAARMAKAAPSVGSDGWLNELIWREFYQQILFHFPDSARQEFQAQYRGIAWESNQEHLLRWKEGRTGFPIVDAAMRELLATGWMHNRARMIVASFFTKDLHLDWRLGEEHFAQHLMDYELASNVGGWQWAASTGTDAQPYFRVFNPELQSKKFDADGDYIRRYVPELAKLNAKQIHAPHATKDLLTRIDYPSPMVDHAKAKDKAIAMFKAKAKPEAA